MSHFHHVERTCFRSYYEDCGLCSDYLAQEAFHPVIDYDCPVRPGGCLHGRCIGEEWISHLPVSELIPMQCYECMYNEVSNLAGHSGSARQVSLQRQWRGVVHQLTADAYGDMRVWYRQWEQQRRERLIAPRPDRWQDVRRRVLRVLRGMAGRGLIPLAVQPDWTALEVDELPEFSRLPSQSHQQPPNRLLFQYIPDAGMISTTDGTSQGAATATRREVAVGPPEVQTVVVTIPEASFMAMCRRGRYINRRLADWTDDTNFDDSDDDLVDDEAVVITANNYIIRPFRPLSARPLADHPIYTPGELLDLNSCSPLSTRPSSPNSEDTQVPGQSSPLTFGADVIEARGMNLLVELVRQELAQAQRRAANSTDNVTPATHPERHSVADLTPRIAQETTEEDTSEEYSNDEENIDPIPD